MNRDLADLLFRSLFCLIFVGLGGEHLMSDELIQMLMPAWVPFQRLVSIGCGIWLVSWGGMILLGWGLRWAALALGVFLLIVTLGVHLPGVIGNPPEIHQDCVWMWTILQRTNLVKNLCLLGVCFHLLYHDVGKYSLENYLRDRLSRRTK